LVGLMAGAIRAAVVVCVMGGLAAVKTCAMMLYRLAYYYYNQHL